MRTKQPYCCRFEQKLNKPRQNCYMVIVVLNLIGVIQPNAATAKEVVLAQEPRLRSLCGPRCIREVLLWYGHEDAGMTTIIKQAESNQSDQFMSMSAIANILQCYDISSCGVRLARKDIFSSSYPIIVHLKSVHKKSPGHFVVWFPQPTKDTISLNDSGHKIEMQWRDFADLTSGAFLFTANDEGALKRTVAETLRKSREKSTLKVTTTQFSASVGSLLTLVGLFFILRRFDSFKLQLLSAIRWRSQMK